MTENSGVSQAAQGYARLGEEGEKGDRTLRTKLDVLFGR